MDKHTAAERSYNMSRIKSKNTKPELFVFSTLDNLNIQYEKHYNTLGKPDVAFPDKKIAVFINGEFWHGKRFKIEKKFYQKFWQDKIRKNIIRDRKNYKHLNENGWKVIKIWDKDLKKNPEKEINKILKALK